MAVLGNGGCSVNLRDNGERIRKGGLGVFYFFKVKIPDVCGPHLHPSAAEEVDQTTTTCNKKYVCFLTSVGCCNQ